MMSMLMMILNVLIMGMLIIKKHTSAGSGDYSDFGSTSTFLHLRKDPNTRNTMQRKNYLLHTFLILIFLSQLIKRKHQRKIKRNHLIIFCIMLVPVGELPLSIVSTRIFKISAKGVQFHPKPR